MLHQRLSTTSFFFLFLKLKLKNYSIFSKKIGAKKNERRGTIAIIYFETQNVDTLYMHLLYVSDFSFSFFFCGVVVYLPI